MPRRRVFPLCRFRTSSAVAVSPPWPCSVFERHCAVCERHCAVCERHCAVFERQLAVFERYCAVFERQLAVVSRARHDRSAGATRSDRRRGTRVPRAWFDGGVVLTNGQVPLRAVGAGSVCSGLRCGDRPAPSNFSCNQYFTAKNIDNSYIMLNFATGKSWTLYALSNLWKFNN